MGKICRNIFFINFRLIMRYIKCWNGLLINHRTHIITQMTSIMWLISISSPSRWMKGHRTLDQRCVSYECIQHWWQYVHLDFHFCESKVWIVAFTTVFALLFNELFAWHCFLINWFWSIWFFVNIFYEDFWQSVSLVII